MPSFLVAGILFLAVTMPAVTGPLAAAAPSPHIDGPSPCTSGSPTYALSGECATFNGANTYYGIYGSGFASSSGWMLCAESPASGADYPEPIYDYVSSSAPAGVALANQSATGWVLSQALATGYFEHGLAGSFSADDFATAAKLFYDSEMWSDPLPTNQGALSTALATLASLLSDYNALSGPLALDVSLEGGASSFAASATLDVSVSGPGLSQPLPNEIISLNLTGATFGSNGLSTLSVTTGATGIIALAIDAPTTPSATTITGSTLTGTDGLSYFAPSALDLGAQTGAAPESPATLTTSLVLANTGTPATTTTTSTTTTTLAPVVATTTTSAAPTTTLLQGHKFNALSPNSAVPGAVYDLYVVNSVPPQLTPLPVAPRDAVRYAGLTYVARSSTNVSGNLIFDVPVGYQWCLHEVSTPAGYILDPALHCTGVLGAVASDTIALPEVASPIVLQVHKFNSLNQSIGVPGAYYDLFVVGAFPTNFSPAPTPTNVIVPPDATLWAIGISNHLGFLSFTLPSGHSWCVREQGSPVGYVHDPVLHCTSVLTSSSPTNTLRIAVPEILAFTGFNGDLLYVAGAFLGIGAVLVGLSVGIRRRSSTRER